MKVILTKKMITTRSAIDQKTNRKTLLKRKKLVLDVATERNVVIYMILLTTKKIDL